MPGDRGKKSKKAAKITKELDTTGDTLSSNDETSHTGDPRTHVATDDILKAIQQMNVNLSGDIGQLRGDVDKLSKDVDKRLSNLESCMSEFRTTLTDVSTRVTTLESCSETYEARLNEL